MNTAGLVAFDKLVERIIKLGITDSALLEQLEIVDEAIWDMQFANSQDALERLAAQAHEEYLQGKTIDLDCDEI